MINSKVDVNRVWNTVMARRAAREKARLTRPYIRLWDGNMNLRGEVAGERGGSFEFAENDTGVAQIRLSLDHYLAKWVMNHKGRAKRNVILTIDKQGARWGGMMDHYKVIRQKNGDRWLEVNFKHDYEHWKHIRVWPNPFFPAEFQFPKIWLIFGPAKWCILVTFLCQLMRLENSFWMLADDPMDDPMPGISTWRHAIKPFSILDDHSTTSLVFSRYASLHDTVADVLADAQLTVTCRRWLTGDPIPWEGFNGRHGVIIWDIEDNSGWRQQTSFGGNMLTGLERALVTIAADGLTEGIDIITGDPTFPDEYYIPGWQGTRPSAPWIVFEEGPLTGIESSEFIYYEATDTQFTTGGHSAPGVNSAISAAIQLAFDLLAAMIAVPPLGGVIDTILAPLYEDVFFAAMSWGDNQRAEALGDWHYFEGWAEGSDRAYTIGAVMALRAKRWETRDHFAVTVKISDAAPYYIGAPGYGHFWLGHRVAVAPLGWPVPHQLFVERVQRLYYEWDENGPKGWDISIGYAEPEDPILKLWKKAQKSASALEALGVV